MNLEDIDKKLDNLIDKVETIVDSLHDNNVKTGINSSKLDTLNGYEEYVTKNSTNIKWMIKAIFIIIGAIVGVFVRTLV